MKVSSEFLGIHITDNVINLKHLTFLRGMEKTEIWKV